ncbi:MAG: hypothetical protein E6G56_07580 [Actinobacteria bacterium]|nr:MAG: hypothetical protein E6G56_07580 [Actinomycetota bacterium]
MPAYGIVLLVLMVRRAWRERFVYRRIPSDMEALTSSLWPGHRRVLVSETVPPNWLRWFFWSGPLRPRPRSRSSPCDRS